MSARHRQKAPIPNTPHSSPTLAPVKYTPPPIRVDALVKRVEELELAVKLLQAEKKEVRSVGAIEHILIYALFQMRRIDIRHFDKCGCQWDPSCAKCFGGSFNVWRSMPEINYGVCFICKKAVTVADRQLPAAFHDPYTDNDCHLICHQHVAKGPFTYPDVGETEKKV